MRRAQVFPTPGLRTSLRPLTLTFLIFCRSCFSSICFRMLHKEMSSKDCNSCQQLWQEGKRSTGEWHGQQTSTSSHFSLQLLLGGLGPLLPP